MIQTIPNGLTWLMYLASKFHSFYFIYGPGDWNISLDQPNIYSICFVLQNEFVSIISDDDNDNSCTMSSNDLAEAEGFYFWYYLNSVMYVIWRTICS